MNAVVATTNKEIPSSLSRLGFCSISAIFLGLMAHAAPATTSRKLHIFERFVSIQPNAFASGVKLGTNNQSRKPMNKRPTIHHTNLVRNKRDSAFQNLSILDKADTI